MSIFWRFCAGRNIRNFVALLVLGPVAAASASALDAAQPLDSITAAAKSTAEERARGLGFDNVSVDVRPLDNRLRLPLCEAALSGSIPQGSSLPGTVSVRVACTEPKAWSIYVRAKVVAQQAVPVLAHPLSRNATIAQSDLKIVDMPLDSVANGMILDPAQIVGKELVRPLDAGSTLRVSQLRAPKVVKRGQLVTLVAGAGGLEVKIQGKAMSDAAAGERVAVSNVSSGKRVEGTANPDGTVTVN